MTDFTPPPPADLDEHRRRFAAPATPQPRVTLGRPASLTPLTPRRAPPLADIMEAEVQSTRLAIDRAATYLAHISRSRAAAARFLRELADDLDPPSADVARILAEAAPGDLA
jgi:hypothetical protein